MISLRTNRCLIVLALTLLGSLSWAGEPNEVPIHLEFEVSPTPLPRIFSSEGMEGSTWKAFYSARPGYAVAIPQVPSVEWLPAAERGTMSDFLGWDDTDRRSATRAAYAEEKGGLSKEQRAFLRAVKPLLTNRRWNLVFNPPDPNGSPRVLLYAVTLEDARKMAQAYYQYARNEWWQGAFTQSIRWTQELAEKVAQEQKKISELDKVIATTQKTLADLGKTMPYRIESEAHEAIVELDRMLNTAQVEIAGITAKLEAIQGYRQERRDEGRGVPQEATARLNMMFVDESIALRGAEARRQMATRLREQANRFVDAKSTLTSTTSERQALGETLKKDQGNLTYQQRNLEDTRQQEPKIPAKLIIYRLQWADEPPANN